MDPNTPAPSAPVHAARLSALLKTLANAEGAVSESIKARRDLISGLEKLLETNRAVLTEDEVKQADYTQKKSVVETKKREVEDEILRKLPSESPHVGNTDGTADGMTNGGHGAEPERPEMEELTPPPIESFTPIASGTPIAATTPVPSPPPAGMENSAFSAFDVVSDMQGPDETAEQGASKKRKLHQDFGTFGSGEGSMSTLDDDVNELLRSESGAAM